MERINIAAPELAYDPEDPEGFRAGMARLGKVLGAAESGITVYELPPGQAVCPYHYEVGEEEWLLVLEGSPTLRTPDSDKVGVWTGDPETDVMVRRASSVDYYEGEA